MVMSKKAKEVVLKEADRAELERWVLAHRTPQQVVLRCRIVLDAASGLQDKKIAEAAGINPKTAALWRGAFSPRGCRKPLAHRGGSRTEADPHGGEGRGHHRDDAPRQARGADALELPHDGAGKRDQQGDGVPHLAGA